MVTFDREETPLQDPCGHVLTALISYDNVLSIYANDKDNKSVCCNGNRNHWFVSFSSAHLYKFRINDVRREATNIKVY
jgi:hypothetical protein